MDAVPARHTHRGSELLETKADWRAQGLDIEPLERYVYSGKGEGHKKIGALFHAIHAAGLCYFPFAGLAGEGGHTRFVVDSLNAVTGFDYSLQELLTAGVKIATMQRVFNIREGINPLQFKVPGRIVGKPPVEAGPLKGVEIDLDTQVRDYLKAMDWDFETAKPSRKILEELGLGDIAKELWP